MKPEIHGGSGGGIRDCLSSFFLKSSAAVILISMTVGNLSPSPQKIPLVFSPSVGEIFRYMLHVSYQAEGKDFFSRDISMEANASGELAFTVKRSIKNLVSMTVTTPGIRVETNSPEESQTYTLKTQDNRAVQAAFDNKGAVAQVHNLEALNRTKIWNISFGHILRDYLPTLPDSSVAPGDIWRGRRTAVIPFEEMDLEVSIERLYRLENILPSQAGDEAVISIIYQVDLSGIKSWENWSGGIEGKGKGEGTLLYNIQKSCIQRFSADYETAATLTIKNRDKILLEHPFHLTISVSLSRLN